MYHFTFVVRCEEVLDEIFTVYKKKQQLQCRCAGIRTLCSPTSQTLIFVVVAGPKNSIMSAQSVPVNCNITESNKERESSPLGYAVFTSFWCLLKLTNWLHYGKKRIKARGALYNLLTVVDNEMLICYSLLEEDWKGSFSVVKGTVSAQCDIFCLSRSN